MASARPQISLAITVLTSVATACSDANESAPPAASEAFARPSTVASWSAEASGTDLFGHVTGLARERAAGRWSERASRLPTGLVGLDYVQARDIRFRAERAIWRDQGPFELQLFHPGTAGPRTVQVFLVSEGRTEPVAFEPGLFSYGELVSDRDLAAPPDAGFAGFRVLHAMNRPDKMDEVVSFLGASYFRLVGPGQVYGLSARGVAVDIAEPGGEEFPNFVAHWVVEPETGADTLEMFALLDGPSLSGAYRFLLRPGRAGDAPTVLDVEARLFFRTSVRKLGIAPLTSMYLHGASPSPPVDDFRPRVHDSEGLLTHTGRGEWIWRPLTNPAGVRVTSLRDVDPSGFGLAQRTREFDAYLDLEAEYHRRPSHWVAVDGAWGAGGVELLEFPTASEFVDNVVAYWAPDDPPGAGRSETYRYRVVTFDARLVGGDLAGAPVPTESLGRVVRTRIGWAALPGQVDPPSRAIRRIVVDFEGGALGELAADQDVVGELSTSSGSVADLRVRPLPGGGRRATFVLEPEDGQGADLRLRLRARGEIVTETWSYLWEPNLVR